MNSGHQAWIQDFYPLNYLTGPGHFLYAPLAIKKEEGRRRERRLVLENACMSTQMFSTELPSFWKRPNSRDIKQTNGCQGREGSS